MNALPPPKVTNMASREPKIQHWNKSRAAQLFVPCDSGTPNRGSRVGGG